MVRVVVSWSHISRASNWVISTNFVVPCQEKDFIFSSLCSVFHFLKVKLIPLLGFEPGGGVSSMISALTTRLSNLHSISKIGISSSWYDEQHYAEINHLDWLKIVTRLAAANRSALLQCSIAATLKFVYGISFRFLLWAVWPELAIFCTLGTFLKPFATINLPKFSTFLGNFCKGAKIIHFSNEIIFGQLL